jgi:hypothetical protein
MEPDESIHIYGAISGGEIGIVIALPADATIRVEGQTVPGMVLSPHEARGLASAIMSEVKRMERQAATN